MAKPIYVPIALPLDEAEEALSAVRAVFNAACVMGETRNARTGRLARSMVTIAKAIDKARATADDAIEEAAA